MTQTARKELNGAWLDGVLDEILTRPELPAGQMEPPVLVEYELANGHAGVVTAFRQNHFGQIAVEVEMHSLRSNEMYTERWHGGETGCQRYTPTQALMEACVTAYSYVHPVDYVAPLASREPEPPREPDLLDMMQAYDEDGCHTCDCGNRLEIDCQTCGECGDHNPLSDLC